MATPLVWYDASTLGGNVGDTVSTMTNTGSWGAGASTAGDLSVPTGVPGGVTGPTITTVNGNKALKFTQNAPTTSYQRLVSSGLDVSGFQLSGDKTYFLVAQYDPSGNDKGRIFSSTYTNNNGGSTLGGNNWLLGHHSNKACIAYTAKMIPETYLNGVEAADEYASGEFQTNRYIYCLTQDTSGALVISTMYVGDSTKIVFKGILAAPLLSNANTPLNLSIGGGSTILPTAELSDCIFCEARVYEGVLDQPSIATIMGSLRTKWGITALLAPPTALSLTGAISIANDTYTGTTAINPAKVSGTLSLNTTNVDPTKPVTFSFSYPTAYTTKNAGPQVVSVPFALTDTDNYTLTAAPTAAAVIDAKSVTYDTSALVPATKGYDSTKTVAVTGAVTVVGKVGADNLTASISTQEFATAAVGTNKIVNVTVALGGSDATNYAAPPPAIIALANTAAITAANLPVTGLNAQSKVADGTTALTISGTPTVAPFSSDISNVTVTSYAAAFPSPAVGCYDISGSVTLGGAAAPNYTGSLTFTNVCITAAGVPETPRTPIPDRYAEHGNSNIIDDYKANAFIVRVQQAPSADAPPNKPMTAGEYIAGKKAMSAARFIR